MSGRLLRKVLKEQEQSRNQNGNDIIHDEDEDLDHTDSESEGHLKNPFDLLNVDEDDDGQDPEQEDDLDIAEDATKEKTDKQASHIEEKSSFVGASSSKKSKKKKKKKGKEVRISDGESLDLVLESFSLDEKVNQQASVVESYTANAKTYDKFRKQSKHSILKVDPKYLNAENELRRIFGSKVVNSFESSSQASSSRQMRSGRRGSHSHRKSIFLSPLDHWPRWDGSLSMELIETKDGCSYFRYVHSPSYSHTQREFEAAKAIHDLNGVAQILMHHPYHVDSLITMADYFKFAGEYHMAADSTAKCLYALECAWHPRFTPLQGDCRLEYTHETNKPLFSTLFTHMKNLDRRGCHRSALEVCKLLLSLDPSDPTGALFCIDYFSLRAGEYAWLKNFSEEYQCDDNYLWNFPNMAFSLAICQFFLEREEGSGKDNGIENQNEAPIHLMKQALMLHPPVLKKLVDKVPLKDQAWKGVLKHGFFKSEETGIPSLDHLIRIYVERSYIIWRLPDVQKLLKDAALSAIETLLQDESEAKTWACARKEAFPSEKNEYKHLLVSDFSDTVATMPPENLQDFIIDPRMAGNQNQNANPDQGARQQGRVPRDLTDRSPLAVLFESILPWVDYGDDEADRHDQPDDHPHEP